MNSNRRLWRWLAIVFVLSFAALGYLGWQIYLAAPPVPKAVITADGKTLFTGDEIKRGQQAWLSAGGQQLGTVWGHGSYVAPDWSADWLHREAIALRDIRANEGFKQSYEQLAATARGAVDAGLKEEIRRNTYDAKADVITVSAQRARAIEQVTRHYEGLFGNDAALAELRSQYAMMDDTLPVPAERKALAAFFFWSAWSAVTDRPGEAGLSYTSNWPHDPMVGNTLSTPAEIVHSAVMETFVWLRVPGDVIFAAGGVLLAWYALELLRRQWRRWPYPPALRWLHRVSRAMKLAGFTEYGLRVLIYLAAQPRRRATIGEIARAFAISESHLTKVVHFLGKKGWLANVRGKGGGLELGRAPHEIPVGAVVRQAEGADLPAECFDVEHNTCPITCICRLRGVLRQAVEAFYAVLDRYTLADLVHNRAALAKVLFAVDLPAQRAREHA